jgi:hypothetical protein
MRSSGDAQLVLVGQNWLAGIWPRIEPQVARLCRDWMPSRYEAADLLAQCSRGEKQLWLATDPAEGAILAVIFTEIAVYPRSRWGRLFALTGTDMRRWLPRLADVTQPNPIAEFFREQGCIGVEATGRKGWGRALEPYGYRAARHTFEREL